MLLALHRNDPRPGAELCDHEDLRRRQGGEQECGELQESEGHVSAILAAS